METDAKGWHLKDKEKNGMAGISLDKAYQYLKGKTSVPVVVAVIDSGVDTLHEDLKNVLWVNPKEVPGNGKDDDGNGYIDDVHGWNFLGNANGEEVEDASSEKARVYHSNKARFQGKQIDTNQLKKEDRYLYKAWSRAAIEIEPDAEKTGQYQMLKGIGAKLNEWDSIVAAETGTKEYNAESLDKLQMATLEGNRAKNGLLNMMRSLPFGADAKNTMILNTLKEETERLKKETEEKDKEPIDVHQTIIKDNYDNFADKFYGNTNIMGKGSMHGTHVSGIIAAERNNGKGVNGIADNVRIMTIRAVPNGDEYDKDIALAIRYAVDNGAKVINMSFGKGYSPQKKWVDEAIRYAAEKDVLLVHAAGNDNKNLDSTENYPSTDFLDERSATNVLTIGASSDTAITNNYISGFSNYGKDHVDLYAPGSQIYSTLPGGTTYGFLDGTSMASPVAAGVAALVRSYFPELTALEVKKAIEEGVTKPTDKWTIIRPGSDVPVKMESLCRTGGFLNAYGAVVKAESMVKKESKKKTKK